MEGNTGVQVGSGNQLHIHYDRAATGPSWPVRVGTMPVVADCYQDRGVDVVLTEGVESAGTVVLVPSATTVVAGMGGVGKTQIATQHVRPLWTDRVVDLAVWITAVDRDSILAGYAQAAEAIGQARYEDPDTAARALLNWLTTTDRRWVIVLDDLQDPKNLQGLWPPHAEAGHTVVTTRRRDAALRRADRRIVEVTPYTADEASSYLHAKLADQPEFLDGAADLAAELGQLPLALAQAAAFVQDLQITFREYLRRFRTGRDVAPDALPDDHQHTVDRTWALSIDRANTLTPAGVSRPLLELLSFLDPNGLPVALPTTAAVLAYLAAHAGRPVSAEDAERAVHNLRRLSLVTTEPAHPENGVRVHALVQHATRTNIPASVEAVIACVAGDALMEIWPDVERDTLLVQSLRTNATELNRLCMTHLWNAGGHAVLFRLGSSLGDAGLITSAITHLQRLQATASDRLGADHPDTLTARRDLAYWRGEGGDVAGATAEYERLLTDRLRVLGADHPDTLNARHELAYWRGAAGDVEGAVADSERVLPDLVRVLGADHPTTLYGRGNVARWRGAAGDVAGAMAEFERVLPDMVRVLGADHPDTLIGRANLARGRGAAGDVAGAIAEFQRLLADQHRILGGDHPDLLTTRDNLAYWQGKTPM